MHDIDHLHLTSIVSNPPSLVTSFSSYLPSSFLAPLLLPFSLSSSSLLFLFLLCLLISLSLFLMPPSSSSLSLPCISFSLPPSLLLSLFPPFFISLFLRLKPSWTDSTNKFLQSSFPYFLQQNWNL